MEAMRHELKIAREWAADRKFSKCIHLGACSQSTVVRKYLACHLATWVRFRTLDYFWEEKFSKSPMWGDILDFMVEIVIEIDKNK